MSTTLRQHGYALLALVAILGLIVTTVFVGKLVSASTKNSRDATTANALSQAKAALIGRAVIDAARPGSLPCPDTDNDGSADPVGGPWAACPAPYHVGQQCPSYVGRLPWRTLGIPDLRDGAGERLWYALSCSLRDFADSPPINSQSVGLLTVGPQSGIAAVIIAPGPPLATQSGRPGNSPTDYLEGRNADGIVNDFEDAPPSDAFNDRLLSIPRDELFAKVAPRIVAEIAHPLSTYRTTHGLYPWADSNGDGQQNAATTAGTIPFADLTPLVFLSGNGWFSIATYNVSSDQLSATLSVGSSTRTLP